LDHGAQRLGVISRLPELVAGFGVDHRDILAAAGLAPDLPMLPGTTITFSQLDALLDAAVRLSGDPHVGLLLGQRAALADLGLVGALMRDAPTPRQAMQDLVDNQHRYVRGSVVYMADQGETVLLGYAIYHAGFRNVHVLAEGALAAGVRYCCEFGAGKPSEILLSRPAPANQRIFSRIFDAPVRFGSEEVALLFPAAQLDRPNPHADPARRARAEAAVRDYWETIEPSVAHMVLRALRSLVLSGRVDLDIVASRLAMHPRTLNRRLRAEGKNFRTLLNEVRFSVACQLLETTRMPITQVALSFGYSDGGAFSHAFRRWSGMSAAQWRRASRSLVQGCRPD
jgi:AraC-like DNA-binding protein